MSSEAQLILDVWEVVRDNVPHTKRPGMAEELLTCFAEYGFEAVDVASIADEDPELEAAYASVYADDLEDEEEEEDDL